MFKTVWYEVIWRNWRKHYRMLRQEKKKSTLRAFASRANKPFAGKFAKDWKKSLKKVLFEKNLALQAQSLLWKFQTRLTSKWRLKFWINDFRIWLNHRKVDSKIFSKSFYRKKVASKTQEIIAKCLKQFDMRLFEEIGGNITGCWDRKRKKVL